MITAFKIGSRNCNGGGAEITGREDFGYLGDEM